MDTQRLLLVVALSFILLLLWQQWQTDYGEPPKPAPASEQTAGTRPGDLAAPPGVDIPESTPSVGAPGTVADSFFDIFTELSVNGGPWVGSDAATRMTLAPNIPEPGTLTMLLTGIFGLAGCMWRRGRSA